MSAKYGQGKYGQDRYSIIETIKKTIKTFYKNKINNFKKTEVYSFYKNNISFKKQG